MGTAVSVKNEGDVPIVVSASKALGGPPHQVLRGGESMAYSLCSASELHLGEYDGGPAPVAEPVVVKPIAAVPVKPKVVHKPVAHKAKKPAKKK